jgi:hypothetical protein
VQGPGATRVAVPPEWRSRQLQLGMDFRSGRRNDRKGASAVVAVNGSEGPQRVCAVTRRRFPVGASPTRRFRSSRKQSEQSWR